MFPFSLPGLRRRAEPDLAGANPLHRLHYPLTPMPRTLVLGQALQPEPNVRSLLQWTVKQIEFARPQALAGTLQDLIEVASLRELGILKLRSLSFPLIVITHDDETRLTESDHERLWRLFRLPALEQVRDRSGRLLAWECEARDGFHLATDPPAELLGIAPSRENCACGKDTPAPVASSAAVA